ncbi:regulator [Vibrio sp. 10N.222.49.B4]|uniref:regulator n=1 Tax=Vibrio sp. 10N.222.49.B4 TaxID=3229613 RepID=UPI00354F22EC
MLGGLLEIPTGRMASPQEVMTGIALLEIQSELEVKTNTELLKLARKIARLMILTNRNV